MESRSTWWAVRPWWKRVPPWWLTALAALGPVALIATGTSRGWVLLLDAALLVLVVVSIVIDVRRLVRSRNAE
jgi:hypothetical protein